MIWGWLGGGWVAVEGSLGGGWVAVNKVVDLVTVCYRGLCRNCGLVDASSCTVAQRMASSVADDLGWLRGGGVAVEMVVAIG